MLEVVGQFGLQYSDQAQGILGSLVAISSIKPEKIQISEKGKTVISVENLKIF